MLGVNVFLTGGTGFIGLRLVTSLIQQGMRVTALVRNPSHSHALELEQLGATLVKGDVTMRESMRLAMQQADVVIHGAGVYQLGLDKAGIERMNAVNIEGTKNTLGLAHELGVKHAIYLSTTWAYGASASSVARDETAIRSVTYATDYERTKKEAHRIALEFGTAGLPLTILCPNAVIGENDHASFGYTLRMYLCNVLPPIAWTPQVRLSLVHLDDLISAIMLTVQKKPIGQTYFIGGEAHTRSEMFTYWQKHAGGLKFRAWLPVEFTKMIFTPLEPLQRAIGLPAVFSRELVEAGRISLYDSSERAKRDLGWTHRSAATMWDDTIAAERLLLAKRAKRDLISLLKPI